jgi:hypothetical protein
MYKHICVFFIVSLFLVSCDEVRDYVTRHTLRRSTIVPLIDKLNAAFTDNTLL